MSDPKLVTDEDVLATFSMNFTQFSSFLTDVPYTVSQYGDEIKELAYSIKESKEKGSKVVGIGWGRSKKSIIRFFKGLTACGVRAYNYPDAASTMPKLGPDDLVIAASGSATTKQTVDDLAFVLGYNKTPKLFCLTHTLKPGKREESVIDYVKEYDGTIIYLKGQQSEAVRDFFKRQMERPPTITPMGTRFENNLVNFFDGLNLQLYAFLQNGEFSFDSFKERHYQTSEYFSRLEEDLNKEAQQKWLLNFIYDLAKARRLIVIATSYMSDAGEMIAGRARNVYSDTVDIFNLDSRMEPIDPYIIPDTMVLSLTKTGRSDFTLRNTKRALVLGASYGIITENPRIALARGTLKKIIEPDSSMHTHHIGKYDLRLDQSEVVLGDCLMMGASSVLGATEEDMKNRHMQGYVTS